MDRDDPQVGAIVTGLLLGLGVASCGGVEVDPGSASRTPDLYATELLRFDPGPHAGFGAERLPAVVLGAPVPGEDGGGSLDVVSLGVGGVIELGFGEREIIDGPGPDFVVFENAFEVASAPGEVFAELAEVSVSEDGARWFTYVCDPSASWSGCAGWRPTAPFDVETTDPLDAEVTGGDPFDLAEVGLRAARFVRIRDLSERGEAPTAGFDLDAVGVVHLLRDSPAPLP